MLFKDGFNAFEQAFKDRELKKALLANVERELKYNQAIIDEYLRENRKTKKKSLEYSKSLIGLLDTRFFDEMVNLHIPLNLIWKNGTGKVEDKDRATVIKKISNNKNIRKLLMSADTELEVIEKYSL